MVDLCLAVACITLLFIEIRPSSLEQERTFNDLSSGIQIAIRVLRLFLLIVRGMQLLRFAMTGSVVIGLGASDEAIIGVDLSSQGEGRKTSI